MHIPNDNGYCGNGRNGHNPLFYRIDHEIIPCFIQVMGHITGKNYHYSLALAEAAGKHAEYMMKQRRVCHAPAHMMVGDAENVGMVLAETMDIRDIERAFWVLAERFCKDYTYGHNLVMYPNTGGGVAIELEKNREPIFYVVQRFARKIA